MNAENKITFSLDTLVELMKQAANYILKDQFNLTFSEFIILVGGHQLGEVPQKEISRISNLSKGMVSRLVSRLEKKGLIQIKINSIDKRSDLISLTKLGHKTAVDSANILEKSFLDYIVRDIPNNEVKAFEATLNKLLKNALYITKKVNS